MSIDTSGLFGWASPDAVEGAAPALAKGGTSYLQSVEDAADIWRQLNAHYKGDGAAEIVEVFRTVTPHAELLEQTAKDAADALVSFAFGIRLLQRRRDQLLPRVEAVNSRAEQEATQCLAPADPLTPEPPVDFMLPLEVAGLANEYRALEEETAAKLLTVALGDSVPANTFTSDSGTILVGVTAAGLKTFKGQQVRVWDPRVVYRRWPDPETALRNMSRGRRVLEGFRTAAVNVREWRPDVSRQLYNNSEVYRRRVDANPSKWVTPAEKIGDFTTLAKGAKVTGGVLTVVTAAATIADERQDAYNELLQANPSMSSAELNERANAVGAVKGGTKAVIDLGAAATGAAIGTVIGGPVGTVAGAAIGIGISVITSQEFGFLGGRSIKDAFADSMMDGADAFFESGAGKGVSAAVDKAGDAAKEIGDNIADCWNSIFGK